MHRLNNVQQPEIKAMPGAVDFVLEDKRVLRTVPGEKQVQLLNSTKTAVLDVFETHDFLDFFSAVNLDKNNFAVKSRNEKNIYIYSCQGLIHVLHKVPAPDTEIAFKELLQKDGKLIGSTAISEHHAYTYSFNEKLEITKTQQRELETPAEAVAIARARAGKR